MKDKNINILKSINSEPANNKKCSAKIVFGEKNTCDTACDGDPRLDSSGDAYIPEPKPKR